MTAKTPTAIMELRGAYKRNPQRRPKGEPKPTGDVGEAPSHLEIMAQRCWRELVDIAPPKVLTNADRWSLELACLLMAKVRTGEYMAAELGQLVRLLTEFGMTPSSRARITVPDDTPKNEFADL